jgi:hypothetical protein
MIKLFKRQNKQKLANAFAITSVVGLAMFPEIALAAAAGGTGGLAKVNTFVDSILSILQGVSIAVVTIAIIWAGYKFLFKNADIAEVGKILAGGLLIGGASELTGFLLTTT